MKKFFVVLLSIFLLTGCADKPIETENSDISIKTESESRTPESEPTDSETDISIPKSGLIMTLEPDSCSFDTAKETSVQLFLINPTYEEIEFPGIYPPEFDFYDNDEWVPLPILGLSLNGGAPPPTMIMPRETRLLGEGTFYSMLEMHWKKDRIIPGKYRLKMCKWHPKDEIVETWYAEFTLT